MLDPINDLVEQFSLLMLVRFAMPLIALGSEAAFQLFLEEDYARPLVGSELAKSR